MKLVPHGPNRTEIQLGNVDVFFSYQTPVAAFVKGQGFFRTDKCWSPTTTRHINKWFDHLGMPADQKDRTKPQEFFDSLVHVPT